MNKIVLVGGGGHCKSVLSSLLKTKEYDEIVVVDKVLQVGSETIGIKVVGDDDQLPVLLDRGFSHAFVTVGSIENCQLREKLYDKIIGLGYEIPNIIDESAIVDSSVKLGHGVFIGKGAILNSDVTVDNMAIINTGSIIEHDCYIGKFSHISVGSVLCGNVKIGDRTLIGANSIVIQQVEVGDGVIVGAGSTVLNKVEANKKCYGIIK